MRKLIVGESLKKELKSYETQIQQRYERLIESILKDPFYGIGKPERLKHFNSLNIWSRRVDKKNRLIYKVTDTTIEIISILDYHKQH